MRRATQRSFWKCGRPQIEIPVADEVLDFAMMLISATHPDSECASEAAKKYVRLGSSPRGGQALISAAKVKALMNGRFNVSYSDIVLWRIRCFATV